MLIYELYKQILRKGGAHIRRQVELALWVADGRLAHYEAVISPAHDPLEPCQLAVSACHWIFRVCLPTLKPYRVLQTNCRAVSWHCFPPDSASETAPQSANLVIPRFGLWVTLLHEGLEIPLLSWSHYCVPILQSHMAFQTFVIDWRQAKNKQRRAHAWGHWPEAFPGWAQSWARLPGSCHPRPQYRPASARWSSSTHLHTQGIQLSTTSSTAQQECNHQVLCFAAVPSMKLSAFWVVQHGRPHIPWHSQQAWKATITTRHSARKMEWPVSALLALLSTLPTRHEGMERAGYILWILTSQKVSDMSDWVKLSDTDLQRTGLNGDGVAQARLVALPCRLNICTVVKPPCVVLRHVLHLECAPLCRHCGHTCQHMSAHARWLPDTLCSMHPQAGSPRMLHTVMHNNPVYAVAMFLGFDLTTCEKWWHFV